jgi:hypothetical protein
LPAQFSAAVNQRETVASGQTREKSGIESPIDHMEIDLYQLKLGLIAFWTLWFAIVCLTNLFAGLKVLGIVPKQTKFASQNFALVTRAVSTYRPPPWLPGLLFCGVILWQFLAALLFARAFLASLTAHALVWSPVNTAFATGIALWAAFMIADEIFVEYNNERSHIMLFAAQLITLVGLHLLPA